MKCCQQAEINIHDQNESIFVDLEKKSLEGYTIACIENDDIDVGDDNDESKTTSPLRHSGVEQLDKLKDFSNDKEQNVDSPEEKVSKQGDITSKQTILPSIDDTLCIPSSTSASTSRAKSTKIKAGTSLLLRKK